MHVYHKWRSYDVWFLTYGAQQTEFFVILDNFLPFYPLTNLENQNFYKRKKMPEDIIILHMCTINDDRMMHGYMCTINDDHIYMVPEIWNRTNRIFSHFGPFFCPFTQQTTKKINILKKMKKSPIDLIILNMCIINFDYMMYGSWDMECDRVFCHFGPFFCHFTPYQLGKSKHGKNEKNAWRYYNFTQV